MATLASIAVIAILAFLDIFAFVFAIGAEMRRNTGSVIAEVSGSRSYCVYNSDASTWYGLSAFGLVMVSQAIISVITRCLCFGRGLVVGSSRGFVISAFVVSCISFVIAEVCLVAGSAKNAYHTKYWGSPALNDLSCASLRKGVFAAGAAFTLIYTVASIVFYWFYSKSETHGWAKHRNEAVLGMTNYGAARGGIGAGSQS